MRCRGIDVVRNKIKTFAQKKVTLPPGRHKIVILDEADRCLLSRTSFLLSNDGSMTPGAQQALRRTMEIFSNTTRFCLACNMSNKIIEPIQSRCAILRYAKLKDQEILKRLLEICEFEKASIMSKIRTTADSVPGAIQRRRIGCTHIHFRRRYATGYQQRAIYAFRFWFRVCR